MNITNKKILALTLSILSTQAYALGSRPPKVDTPAHRKPKAGAKVLYVRDGFTINSARDIPKFGKVSGNNPVIWDLQGGIIDASKQRGDGGQSENQEPVFRAQISLVVKNGFVRNTKDGMRFFKPNSGVDRLTFTNIGEDAVSTVKGAFGFEVRNSEFINKRSGDKSIQTTEASGARIVGNLIFSGITCIRVGAKGVTTPSDRVEIENNRFVGCETAVNAGAITVIQSGNKYEKVDERNVNSDGAIVRNE
jgi:hypothetical protein